jgi:2-C-methyl-D-erythritol 4-phosphate cytidylyltransferase
VGAGAIIVAAGSGERLGFGVPKALVRAAGRPLVTWSAEAIAGARGIDAVVIVAPPGDEKGVAAALGESIPIHDIVSGGTSRQRSVAAGLAALPAHLDAILVHDAARPLITRAMVEAVLDGLADYDGAIAAAPVADTLKREGPHGVVGETVDRSGLWGAQTPQAFRAAVIRGVFADADDAELDAATDCAGMAERRGIAVCLVNTGRPNIKVTVPADLALVEALLGGTRIA